MVFQFPVLNVYTICPLPAHTHIHQLRLQMALHPHPQHPHMLAPHSLAPAPIANSSQAQFLPSFVKSRLPWDFPGGPVAKIGCSPLTHSPKGYQTSVVAKSIPSDATKDLDTPRHSTATTLCPSPASTSPGETSRQWAMWVGDTTRRLVAWRWDLETSLKEKGAPESFSVS